MTTFLPSRKSEKNLHPCIVWSAFWVSLPQHNEKTNSPVNLFSQFILSVLLMVLSLSLIHCTPTPLITSVSRRYGHWRTPKRSPSVVKPGGMECNRHMIEDFCLLCTEMLPVVIYYQQQPTPQNNVSATQWFLTEQKCHTQKVHAKKEKLPRRLGSRLLKQKIILFFNCRVYRPVTPLVSPTNSRCLQLPQHTLWNFACWHSAHRTILAHLSEAC